MKLNISGLLKSIDKSRFFEEIVLHFVTFRYDSLRFSRKQCRNCKVCLKSFDVLCAQICRCKRDEDFKIPI